MFLEARTIDAFCSKKKTQLFTKKKLSLCLKLNFFIHIFFQSDGANLWYFNLRYFEISKVTTSVCIDIVIRRFESVAKTLLPNQVYLARKKDLKNLSWLLKQQDHFVFFCSCCKYFYFCISLLQMNILVSLNLLSRNYH